MHVFLIEDDALVACGIAAGLRLHAMTVDHVATGRNAEHLLQTGHFDLVILDLGLPDMDGMHLVKRWRAAGRMLPMRWNIGSRSCRPAQTTI